MAIVKCNNGHHYNDSESASCPYCSGAVGQTIALGQTNFSNGGTVMLDDVGTASAGGGAIPITGFVENTEYGGTVIIDEKKNSEVKPVRGWLIVVEGEKCGLDFRIHTGNNSVGRSHKNDICFDFDQTISKERCCVITYDDRAKQFFISLGESTNNIYVNNKILLQPTAIVDFDIIEIGKTKLVFRSLCNEQFDY